jgi:hypothetical protein
VCLPAGAGGWLGPSSLRRACPEGYQTTGHGATVKRVAPRPAARYGYAQAHRSEDGPASARRPIQAHAVAQADPVDVLAPHGR